MSLSSLTDRPTLLKRHMTTDNCTWEPWMVGPLCRPKKAVKLAAMTGHDSYYTAVKHEKATTWFLLAILALGILPGLLHRLRVSRPQYAKKLVSITGYRKVSALLRGIGYRQYKGLWGSMPSRGTIVALLVIFLTTFLYDLIYQPWYRPLAVWGSSPLAIRSGLIANAFMPFVFILAIKINPITVLTGVSHERLQVYHQWIARMVLLFAIIHGGAFIAQPIKDGGLKNLTAWWYFDAPLWNTGAISISLLAWLVASSTRVFRNMSYEFFVLQHIITAIGFIVVYIMHTEAMIESWKWYTPIIVVWAASTFLRWARAAASSNFFLGTQTDVEVRVTRNVDGGSGSNPDGEDVVRLTIQTPVRWAPGQHVFIRFPTLAPLQSHPFTVLNLPQPDDKLESSLVLLAKVRYGVTQKLLAHVQEKGCDCEFDAVVESVQQGASPQEAADAHAQQQHSCCAEKSSNDLLRTRPSSSSSQDSDAKSHFGDDLEAISPADEKKTLGAGAAEDDPAASGIKMPVTTRSVRLSAIIDGPYGQNASMTSYTDVVLIAGGLGGTLVLPILMDLAVRARRAPQHSLCRSVRVVLALRKACLLDWYGEYLCAVRGILETHGVAVAFDVHVTDDEPYLARALAAQGSHRQRAHDTLVPAGTPVGDADADEDEKERPSGAGAGAGAALAAGKSCCAAKATEPAQTQTQAQAQDPTALLAAAEDSVRSPLRALLPCVRAGRPDIRACIFDVAQRASGSGSGGTSAGGPRMLGVAVCGPEGMADATSNAVGALQWEVLAGRMGSLREAYLHREGFSW